MSIDRLTVFEPVHQFPQRHDSKIPSIEPAVAFERGDIDTERVGRFARLHAMKGDDDGGIAKQDGVEMRGE